VMLQVEWAGKYCQCLILKIKLEHHLKGRRNAAKPEAEKATSQIQIRCVPTDKSLIVRNLLTGETLGSFMMGLAIEEATKRSKK
jgi:hypothetical protein